MQVEKVCETFRKVTRYSAEDAKLKVAALGTVVTEAIWSLKIVHSEQQSTSPQPLPRTLSCQLMILSLPLSQQKHHPINIKLFEWTSESVEWIGWDWRESPCTGTGPPCCKPILPTCKWRNWPHPHWDWGSLRIWEKLN